MTERTIAGALLLASIFVALHLVGRWNSPGPGLEKRFKLEAELSGIANSPQWSDFQPRNAFVKSEALYDPLKTLINGQECPKGHCAGLLRSGTYRVERFGLKSNSVIQLQYPIYYVEYEVADGFRAESDWSRPDAGSTTIGFIGDQNVWGEGRSEKEYFVALLANSQIQNGSRILNLSRCPFADECRLKNSLESTAEKLKRFSYRNLKLVFLLFERPPPEELQHIKNFIERTKQEFETEVTLLAFAWTPVSERDELTAIIEELGGADYRNLDLQKISNGRHRDYPEKILSTLGHRLVFEVVRDELQSRGLLR